MLGSYVCRLLGFAESPRQNDDGSKQLERWKDAGSSDADCVHIEYHQLPGQRNWIMHKPCRRS